MERGDSIHSDGHENDMLDPLLAKEDRVVFGDEEDEWKCSKDLVWEEVKKQCWIAGPMMLVNLLQFGLRMISVMLVGHLGQLALSSASIATSFANFSGTSVLGLWLGIICGLSVQSILLFLVTTCIDWEQEARNAKRQSIVYASSLPTVPDDIIKDDKNYKP